jgi:hypothetical protein
LVLKALMMSEYLEAGYKLEKKVMTLSLLCC